MKEQLITFKTAKLAKEKGFNLKTYSNVFRSNQQGNKIYHETTVNLINWNFRKNKSDFEKYSAPTQSLLQKWLRDKYQIQITIINIELKSLIYRYIIGESIEEEEKGNFNIYEDALEIALQEALKLIK